MKIFILFVKIVFITCEGPHFTSEPSSRFLFTNNSGTVISCTASGHPIPQISWRTAELSTINDVPGLRYQRSDGSLVFPPFAAHKYRQDIHHSKYQCIASNKFGTIASRVVNVKAALVTTVDIKVYDEFVFRGNTAVFKCQIPNTMKDFVEIVSWHVNDIIVIRSKETKDKFTAYPQGELHIRSVDFSDSNLKFKCEIRNQLLGKTVLSQTSGQLTVMGNVDEHNNNNAVIIQMNRVLEGRGTMAPKIFHQINDVLANEDDESVLLPCAAQGNPVPKYKWFKQSESGKLSPLTVDERVVTFDGTLIIMRPTIKDSYKYICVVTNNLGNSKCEVNLIIRQTLNVKINSEKSFLTMTSGETITLNCSVTGYPLNSIKWKKDLKIVKEMKSDDNQRQQLNSLSIELTSFDRKDAGIFQCFAENDFESFQTQIQLNFVDESPVFESTFTEQTFNPGNGLSLSCSATGNPLPQITWTLDETQFPSSHRVRYGDYVTRGKKVTSYVNITSTRVEDGGLYRCTATNNVATITHQAKVNIFGPPSVKTMKNLTALEGENLRLYCPVYGYPIRKVFWRKDSNILPVHGQQNVYANGSLFITNVNRKMDEGLYSCYAENDDGKRGESSTFMKVIVGPRIDPFVFAKDLEEGMRSVAVCAVLSGDPPIRISWLKDGHNLDKHSGVSVEMINSFTSTISFHSLTTQHSGNYTCLATNSASKANFTAELVVKVPPFWVKEPKNTEVLIGQRLVLDCQANGFPEPQIRWKRLKSNEMASNSPFKTIISSPHMHILENGSLLINQIENSDEARFMCQASNNVNPSLSKVLDLKVNSPPRFSEKFVSKVVLKANPLRLQCNASGNTPISYHWKKDDLTLQQIMDTVRYSVVGDRNTTTLRIDSVARTDSTLFTCSASNAYGVDEMNFRVIVQESPEAPFNLNVEGVSSNSVTVSWSQPYNGNSPLLEYELEYKKSEEISWNKRIEQITKPANILNAMLNKLLSSHSYDIRIRAKNSLGKSNYSDILTVKTLEEAPSSPPTALETKATGSSSVVVSWTKPEQKTTISLKGYYIALRIFESNSKFTFKTIEATKNNREEFHVKGLKKGTKYEMKIQAYNNAGNGPFSDVSIVKTLEFDAPKAAIITVIKTTPSTIEVECSLEEQQITGFILHYKAEEGDWIEEHLSEMKATVIDGLKCGTKYYIYVQGVNDAGVGEASDTIIVKTDGSAPVAPEKSSFLTSNSSFVLLNLHSWNTNGCPIVYFDVHYKQQGDKEWTVFSTNVPAFREFLEISNLSPGSWYSLLMRAVNDAGSTDAEYVFSTLMTTGATIPPLLIKSSAPETTLQLPFIEKWILEKLNFILPIICVILVFSLGIAIICCFRLKQQNNLHEMTTTQRHSNGESESEYKGESVSSPCADLSLASLKMGSNAPDARLSLDQIQNVDSRGDAIYYPSPYAFSQISDYNIDVHSEEETYKLHPINRTSSSSFHHQHHQLHHNYDTPLFVKRIRQFTPQQF